MAILDKAKTAAERARGQAARGMERGRARIDQAQARREYNRLLRQLGETCYAEHTGEGTHEAVVRAIAAVDAHVETRPEVRAPGRPGTRAPSRPEPVRLAREIMHPGAECIGEDESVATAAQRMRDLGVGALPICGADDRLHGILTDRDMVIRCIAEGRDPAQMRAGELAQGSVYWVEATADVGEVLHQMEDHHVKRLPVIDNRRLVGIISEADLARHLDERRLAEFVEKVYATN